MCPGPGVPTGMASNLIPLFIIIFLFIITCIILYYLIYNFSLGTKASGFKILFRLSIKINFYTYYIHSHPVQYSVTQISQVFAKVSRCYLVGV